MTELTTNLDDILKTGDEENTKLYLQLLKGQGLTTTPFLEELKTLGANLGKKFSTNEEVVDFFLLQNLSLSNNQLQQLPKELCNLQNLQNLYLSNNQLQQLPKELCNLQNLENLDLGNNQLQPSAIDYLRKQLPNCNIYF